MKKFAFVLLSLSALSVSAQVLLIQSKPKAPTLQFGFTDTANRCLVLKEASRIDIGMDNVRILTAGSV